MHCSITIGKRDVTGQVSYTHISSTNNVSLFGQIQMPIFDRNQGEIARSAFAITQAQEQEKYASGQVLTDVRDAFESIRTNDKIISLYKSGYLDDAQKVPGDISGKWPTIYGAASLLDFLDAGCCNQQTTALRAVARNVPARARTASRSRRNQEPAMKNRLVAGHGIPYLMAIAALTALAACHSNDSDQAGQMTSFSAKASKSATPQLFTIPQNQMSHVQIVTVEPATLKRTLRLTGAVAYNAFKTTPVISQVGGPVSRILVVPGEHVKEGQPMLDVSSPDYSQLLDAYLKAADSFRLSSKNYTRAQDLYAHHAIAERDPEAGGVRSQLYVQADLNAAEQGQKIAGSWRSLPPGKRPFGCAGGGHGSHYR